MSDLCQVLPDVDGRIYGIVPSSMTPASRRPAPPGGMPPPASAELPDGTVVELAPLAAEVSDAHLARHPEDVERYGAELAHAWCTHDFQHVLAWAVGDLDLEGQVGWLSRVLAARDYPVANLISCLGTAAEIVERRIPAPDGAVVAGRLHAAATSIQSPGGG